VLSEWEVQADGVVRLRFGSTFDGLDPFVEIGIGGCIKINGVAIGDAAPVGDTPADTWDVYPGQGPIPTGTQITLEIVYPCRNISGPLGGGVAPEKMTIGLVP
jgi:hypothetical protein